MDERKTKPLISTEGEDRESTTQEQRGGCLSNLTGIAGFIFIILIILHSCGGDHKENTSEDTKPQLEQTETTEPIDDTPSISSYEVSIILNYEEVSLTTNSPMNVCVDDLVIGRQDAGTEEIYTVTLDEGKHKFYLKNDGLYSTSKLSFDVSEQNTYFRFGTKTRLTFGMTVWKDFADNERPTSTITNDSSPVLDGGEWIDISLAKLGDYSLNAMLSPDLYNVMESAVNFSDIRYLENDMVLSVSANLIPNDDLIYATYERLGEDMEQTIDTMFEMACDALSETAAEACSDYKLQVSKPIVENRTIGSTVWRVCTCTGSRESDDMTLSMSHYFYMDENLRASITISCIISDSAAHSNEVEAFSTWVDVLQSSLELERNAQETTGN